MEEITREEIIQSLQNNAGFVFNFAIDNNYSGLVSALAANGFSPDDEEKALENLKFLYEFDRPKLITVLGQVPYENAANNWTAGLDEIFRPPKPDLGTLTTRSTDLWGSILGGIGGLLTGVSGSLSGDSSTLTAQQIEMQRAAAEAAKKRKDRNTLIIILVITAAIIGGAIYFNKNKKGKKKS